MKNVKFCTRCQREIPLSSFRTGRGIFGCIPCEQKADIEMASVIKNSAEPVSKLKYENRFISDWLKIPERIPLTADAYKQKSNYIKNPKEWDKECLIFLKSISEDKITARTKFKGRMLMTLNSNYPLSFAYYKNVIDKRNNNTFVLDDKIFSILSKMPKEKINSRRL